MVSCQGEKEADTGACVGIKSVLEAAVHKEVGAAPDTPLMGQPFPAFHLYLGLYVFPAPVGSGF